MITRAKDSQLKTLIKQIKDDLEKNDEKLYGAEKERVGSFRELKSELENQRKITEQLSTTTENLKKFCPTINSEDSSVNR